MHVRVHALPRICPKLLMNQELCRDLIEGADKIVDISRKCNDILKNVHSIQVSMVIHKMLCTIDK